MSEPTSEELFNQAMEPYNRLTPERRSIVDHIIDAEVEIDDLVFDGDTVLSVAAEHLWAARRAILGLPARRHLRSVN